MTESLQQALDRVGNAVDLLRDAPVASVPFHGAPEHSNWMTEQRAWRESVALLDQSHHMNDLFISGPDALRLFQDFGVNRVDDYAVGKAKHLVTVNRDGLFIGDNILFHLETDSFDLVGQPFSVNWIEYQADDRRLRRRGPPGSTDPVSRRAAAGAVPLRAPGSERAAAGRAPHRRGGAAREVLHDDPADHRRAAGARPPPRDGRPARAGAVRSLGRTARPSWMPSSRSVTSSASTGWGPRPTRRRTWSRAGCPPSSRRSTTATR